VFGAAPDDLVALVVEPGDTTDFVDEDGVDVAAFDSGAEPVVLLTVVVSGAGDDVDVLAGVLRGVLVGSVLAQLVEPARGDLIARRDTVAEREGAGGARPSPCD
jgi:hypothetical protein